MIFFRFFLLKFKNGPPEAVIKIFSIFSFESLIKDQIEKCSESIGINLVLFILNFFSIKFHAHIKDSLLAIAIVFVKGIIFKVGSKPSKPLMALIV